MRIINLYTAPEANLKVQIFKIFYKLLTVGYHTILCGDFNAFTHE